MMDVLSRLLSSRVRAKIFGLLFDGSVSEVHLRDMSRRSGLAVRTVQQDLQNLLALELVCTRRDGNRLYFRANEVHPAYPEIQALVQKMTGAVPLLRAALENRPDIRIAFVFGSMAKREMRASSDIDLMVIGEIGLRKLTSLLSGIAAKVQREINPYVLKAHVFRERKRKADHFLKQVLDSPKLFVVGADGELEAVGAEPLIQTGLASDISDQI